MNKKKPTHDALVNAIYESALNPAKWKDTLNQLSAYYNASAVNMIGIDVNNFDNPFLLSQNLPSDSGKYYKSYWREHDIWVQAGINKGFDKGGKTLIGNMLVDRHTLLKSTFYNEWLLTKLNVSDVLSTNLWNDNPNSPRIVLCFYRDVDQNCFQESDRLSLHHIAQHLTRAFCITYQLKLSEQKNVIEESFLNSLSHALFTLDHDRKIIEYNATAMRLLRNYPGLIKIRHERIIALGSHAYPSIDKAIALANCGHHAEIVFTSNQFGTINNIHHARLTQLKETTVWPLTHSVHYLLLVEKHQEIKQETFRAYCALFKITASEQRVLYNLMQDAMPEEIAQTLNISLTTIRSHIQNIKQKTGVCRITELVRKALIATRSI